MCNSSVSLATLKRSLVPCGQWLPCCALQIQDRPFRSSERAPQLGTSVFPQSEMGSHVGLEQRSGMLASVLRTESRREETRSSVRRLRARVSSDGSSGQAAVEEAERSGQSRYFGCRAHRTGCQIRYRVWRNMRQVTGGGGVCGREIGGSVSDVLSS